MIYLQDRYIEMVHSILRQHVPDRLVVVFGSRVSGKTKPFSDIDLAIMGNEPLSLSTQAALSDAFSNSNLPYRVDIVDWAATSQEFREVIKKNCEEIYAPRSRLSWSSWPP